MCNSITHLYRLHYQTYENQGRCPAMVQKSNKWCRREKRNCCRRQNASSPVRAKYIRNQIYSGHRQQTHPNIWKIKVGRNGYNREILLGRLNRAEWIHMFKITYLHKIRAPNGCHSRLSTVNVQILKL